MSLASAVASLSAGYGAGYTLRQGGATTGANAWTLGAETPSYAPCRGRERHATAKDVRAGINEGATLIVLDAASLSVVPRKGDNIALGTWPADSLDRIEIDFTVSTFAAGTGHHGSVLIYSSGTRAGEEGADWRQVVNVYPVREGAAIRLWRLEVSR